MLQKFMNTIKEYNMLEKGDKVLVGLSGGADSVCLLLNLLEISTEFELKVSAIHLNHQLRGQESDNDESFCIDLCKMLGVFLTTERLDVISYSSETGKSVEEAARDLRYKAFEKCACGSKIATAHSLSDNAETVLYNLTRGTGLKGLCGIPPVRGEIIRPLINTTREEIEEYLSDKGQAFVTDRTNLTTDYTRNKIRLKIIPKLKEINPNFIGTIQKNVQLFTLENNYIAISTKEVYNSCRISKSSLNAALLLNEHTAIRRRCITMLLKENNIGQSFDRITAIDNILESGGKINLTKDVYFVVKMGILSIIEILSETPIIKQEMHIGTNTFLSKKVEINMISIREFVDEKNVNKKFAIDYLDYDKIQGKVVLRNRQNGDKIQLLNRNFESSVKKLFNAKIPLGERFQQVFLADKEGAIFIESFGISDRVKIDTTTTKILRIAVDGSVKN